MASGLAEGATTGGASGTSAPRSTAETWASERTPNTVMPGTRPASAACGSGTNTRLMPWADAAMTIGSTPGTGRSPPDTDSSPMKAHPSSRLGRQLLVLLVGSQDRDRDGQVVVGAASWAGRPGTAGS